MLHFSQLRHSATLVGFFCVFTLQDSFSCFNSQYNISYHSLVGIARACGALHVFGQRWWAIKIFQLIFTDQPIRRASNHFLLPSTFHHWIIGLLNLQYMVICIWMCTISALRAFQCVILVWPSEQWILRAWLSLRPQLHLEFYFQWRLTVLNMTGFWFQLLPQSNEAPPNLFHLRFVIGLPVLNNLLN